MMNKRIIFNLLLLGAVFYLPWWAVAVIAFMGAFLWPPYYEIIAFGLLVDLLYGAASLPLGGIFGVLSAAVIFVVASAIKKAVR